MNSPKSIMESKPKIAFVLGIRPDVIRAALMIKELKKDTRVETIFIWSGQHYSDNLKDIFFRELDVPKPDIELGCGGETDADTVSSIVSKLYTTLVDIKPDVVVFLGDTNTVIGSISVAQLNIPIVHIEGCMRSYDWRMPEEKYRTTIDHLSDLIYCYLDEYKEQGVREGLNPRNIVVVGNPIVDILNEFYYSKMNLYDKDEGDEFFKSRKIVKNNYYVMTCHRRENVENPEPLKKVLRLASMIKDTVYFPASYRTQKRMKDFGIEVPTNCIVVDPVGYTEFLTLLTASKGTITDSGTVVEEACVMKIPSIQMRKATERPQVYDVKSSIKFDPALEYSNVDLEKIISRFEELNSTRNWPNPFGDGKSSKRIVEDLIERVLKNSLKGHQIENYHIDTKHAYSG